MNTPPLEWPSSLDDAEVEELDRYFRNQGDATDLLLDGVHGLLSALVVGPFQVLPEEWLPQILHGPFENLDAGNRILALLAKLNDSITAELELDAYEPILGEVDAEEGPMLSAAGWCEGFSRGVDMHATLWEKRLAEDPRLMELLGPVMALAVDEGILSSAEVEFERLSDEDYDDCVGQIPAVLNGLNVYWQEHPTTEAELNTLAKQHETQSNEESPQPPPPRQRGGHWLH